MIGWLLIVAGAILFVAGVARGRGPWARYRALKLQEDNIARYEAWRGGLRDEGETGASVAMAILRIQARNGAILAVGGVVPIVAGFALPA